MKLIVCESVVAITLHLRDTTVIPPNFGGHHPRPKALCDAEIAWDTKLPLSAARCHVCLDRAKEQG